MSDYQNPFTGSELKVTDFKLEDDIEDFQKWKFRSDLQPEDENERFILYKNGLLIKKTKSEKKYFPIKK